MQIAVEFDLNVFFLFIPFWALCFCITNTIYYNFKTFKEKFNSQTSGRKYSFPLAVGRNKALPFELTLETTFVEVYESIVAEILGARDYFEISNKKKKKISEELLT